jgi:hypothetical protein
MLHVVLWKWTQAGFKHVYTAEHVNVMVDMIRRHSRSMTVRVICVTDDPSGIDRCETFPLWDDHATLNNRSGANLPSCYRRLKLFDPATQEALKIAAGDRICSLDIDSVIVNDMRPLWSKPQHFVGWAVRGTHHMRVFNGSMWMFTAREHAEVWHDFIPFKSPDDVHRAGYLGSDQAWLSHKFAKDTACGTWAYPFAVSYPREVARRPQLTPGTSIVFFHGKFKPWHERTLREAVWVKEHWRASEQPVRKGAVQITAQGTQAEAAAI